MVAPLIAEYVPEAHFVHCDDADDAPIDDDHVPILQLTHVLTDVAPLVGEYVPAMHFVHDDEP